MSSRLYDIMPANERSRILSTEKDLPDAFDFCRSQEGLDLVIRDRYPMYFQGSRCHRVWYISCDGTVTRGHEV